MFKKCCLLLSASLFLVSALSAQKVKWKDGLLLIDGKPSFSYETIMARGNKIYIYTNLSGDQDLWEAHYCRNRNPSGSDDYRHYYFPTIDREMILPRKTKYNFKHLLPKMLDQGVVTREGELNDDALRKFVDRYHVPLPKKWGSPVHQLPVIDPVTGKGHIWKE